MVRRRRRPARRPFNPAPVVGAVVAVLMLAVVAFVAMGRPKDHPAADQVQVPPSQEVAAATPPVPVADVVDSEPKPSTEPPAEPEPSEPEQPEPGPEPEPVRISARMDALVRSYESAFDARIDDRLRTFRSAGYDQAALQKLKDEMLELKPVMSGRFASLLQYADAQGAKSIPDAALYEWADTWHAQGDHSFAHAKFSQMRDYYEPLGLE